MDSKERVKMKRLLGMDPQQYVSVATAERVLSPDSDEFDHLYISQTQDRMRIVEEEKACVEKMHDFVRRFQLEFSHLSGEVCQARMQFNAMANIFRLPNEILALIFEVYVADVWPQDIPLHGWMGFPPWSRPYSWIRQVLHVCHQWRCVALSAPQLWTCIAPYGCNSNWPLNFLLEHAGDLPLTVLDPGYDNTYSKHIRETFRLLKNIQRVKTLALAVNALNKSWLRSLGGPGMEASSMRHLGLDLSDRGDINAGKDAASLLSNISLPYLQSLTVTKAPIELVRRLSCSSLIDLNITSRDEVLSGGLLDILKGLPVLKHFSVNHVIADPSFDSDVVLRCAISLNSLEHLQIRGKSSGAAQILNQLAFPLDTHIELWTDDFEASALSSMMPTVLRSSSNGECLPGLTEYESWVCPHTIIFRTRVRDQGAYMCMSACFWRTSIPVSTLQVTSSAGIMLLPSTQSPTTDPLWVASDHLRLSLYTKCYSQEVPQQYAILGTEELLSLTMDSTWASAEMWKRIVDPAIFPKLKTLTISGHFPRCFWQELIIRLEASQPVPSLDDGALNNPASSCITRVSSSDLPLPRLRILTLRDLVYYTHGGLEKTLLGPLQRCADLGYKFRRLHLLDIFSQDAEDLSTCITGIQDAISKLGVADEVVVSVRPPGSRAE